MRCLPSILALAILLAGCKKEEEIQYAQFNAEDDELTIFVGESELGDPVEIELFSSTGEVAVGRAEVDPDGGPIGTHHEIVLEVYDDYQDGIDRVSVRTDSPGRGEDEYDLDQDSADEGYYKITLETVGDAGETREDTLTFRLWEALATEE